MKLTLRLVDKSYRVLDQITYISKFLDADDLVRAAQVGNEAAEALSDAIDFKALDECRRLGVRGD